MHKTRHSVERVWKQEKVKAKTIALLKRYAQEPNHQIRNQIAMLNKGLVKTNAEKFAEKCDVPRQDLEQIGFIGLIKAVERFDLSMGLAFSSYAVPSIVGEIQHYLRDQKHIAKTPRRWQETADAARRVQARLQKYGREVSTEEAAVMALGVEERRWEWIETATSSLNTQSLEELEFFEVPDESNNRVGEDEMQEVVIAAVQQQVTQLPEMVKTCVVECYWDGLKPKVIAQRHGLSKDNVERLISEGLERIRNGFIGSTTDQA